MARSRRRSGARVSFFAFQDIITSVSGILIIIVLLMVLMVEEAPPGEGKGSPHAGSAQRLAGVTAALDQIREDIKKFQAVLKGLITAPRPEEIQKEIKLLEEEIAKLEAQVKEKNIHVDFHVMPPSEQAGELADAKAINQAIDKELAGKTDERDKLLDLKRELEADISKARNNVFITAGNPDDNKTPAILIVSGKGLEQFSIGKNEPEASHDAAATPAAFKQLLGALDPAGKYVLFYIKPSGIQLFGQLLEEVRKTQFAVGYDALAENATPKFGPPAAPAAP
jgi:hypothetical protein